MEDNSVYLYIKLYTTPDKFYLKPSKLYSTSSEVLVIDRVTEEAAVQDLDLAKVLGSEDGYRLILGFLGTIRLISGLYLVVVTDKTLLGGFDGHIIFQVDATEIIPYAHSNKHLTSQQIKDNAQYERMVRLILDMPGAYYFSHNYDLTHTLQHLNTVTSDYYKKSLVSRADKRFLWNHHLLKDFSDEQFDRFTLPIIQGFVSINHTTVNDHKLLFCLISRRSVERAGPKLFARGIDAQGNVANHVVTEQIIQCDGMTSSFVTTRGSIPIYWTQYPDLRLFTAVNILGEDHVTPYVKHMNDQQQRYGNIVCVNLIGQSHGESALEDCFDATARAAGLRGVKYLPFDFHAECRVMRYDKLNILTDSLAKELKEFGYFYNKHDTVVSHQSGTFRMNCLDSLDRTNVVQAILNKLQLKAILKRLAVTKSDDEQLTEFESLVNNVWADHADMISVQYSGTAGLKTDFTRTGKRTYTGVIMDFVYAIARYYINNFRDGFKQDAFDLFLGNYVVPDNKSNREPYPFRRHNSWKHVTLPSIFLIAVFMFCISIFLTEGYGSELLLYLMFWGTIAAAALHYIRRNRNEFVNWPKLCVIERNPTSKLKSL